jgi:hypothetical protein
VPRCLQMAAPRITSPDNKTRCELQTAEFEGYFSRSFDLGELTKTILGILGAVLNNSRSDRVGASIPRAPKGRPHGWSEPVEIPVTSLSLGCQCANSKCRRWRVSATSVAITLQFHPNRSRSSRLLAPRLPQRNACCWCSRGVASSFIRPGGSNSCAGLGWRGVTFESASDHGCNGRTGATTAEFEKTNESRRRENRSNKVRVRKWMGNERGRWAVGLF